MKNLLSILLVVLFCISCSDDRALRPDNSPKLSGLLKSITINTNDTTYRHVYEYLNSTTLKSITHTVNGKSIREDFEYENDTLKYSIKGDTIKKYLYQEGRLKYIRKGLSSTPSVYELSNFYYYTSRELYFIEKSLVSEFSNEFTSETSFRWSGNNAASVQERHSNWVTINSEFKYEKTLDPLYILYQKILRIPSNDLDGISLNNYAEVDVLTSDVKYKNEGKYNKEGFPTKKTILKLESGSTDWKPYREYSYEYYE